MCYFTFPPLMEMLKSSLKILQSLLDIACKGFSLQCLSSKIILASLLASFFKRFLVIRGWATWGVSNVGGGGGGSNIGGV